MAEYGTENEVRIPDVELLIQAASSDVAVVAFYVGKKVDDPVEIVASVIEYDAIGAIRAILQMAIHALYSQGWLSLDELDTRSVEEKRDPPF